MKKPTVLDFVRANPGCTHDTPGANFHGARLARLHWLLDNGQVRYEQGVNASGASAWQYWAVEPPKREP